MPLFKETSVTKGWFHVKAPRKTWQFFFDFWPKKNKLYFSYINVFKQILVIFYQFWKCYRFFFSLKNEIFNIFYYYSFQVKRIIPSVTGQNTLNSYTKKNVFKGIFFVCFTPWYIFWCFSLFWSPGPLRISNFKSAFLCQLFQPSNPFDKKKSCAFDVLRYGLEPKQPRLVVLGT